MTCPSRLYIHGHGDNLAIIAMDASDDAATDSERDNLAMIATEGATGSDNATERQLSYNRRGR